MQKPGLTETNNKTADKKIERKSFWQRQFQKKTTKAQTRFDWTFGVILPVICCVLDPFVFNGGIVGYAYLGKYKPFAYILSFVSIMAMSAFLLWGKKLKWINGFFSGFFAVGAAISLIVGLIILPMSLFGLIILIGALGYTPFLSSLTFLRNSIRAFWCAKPHFNNKVLIRSAALAALFGLVTPAVINFEIQSLLNGMKNGDVQTIRKNSQYLKYAAPITNFDELLTIYQTEPESERADAIEEAYEELTGEDFNKNLNRYNNFGFVV